MALLTASILFGATGAEAARVVVRKGARVTRVRVTVHPGFPIRRALPNVVVRPAPLVRVSPRVYLAPVAFAAVAIAVPPAGARAWNGAETLDRDEGWTDFTMNVD